MAILPPLVGADLSNVNAVTVQFTLTFQALIQLPDATVDFVENRAAQRSGRAQPDLRAMMAVYGALETLADAASALLALDETEWLEFTMEDPEPPCDDIEPPTCDFFSEQDYHGADPGMNMSYAWTQGGRGQGIQIADVERGYIRGHEDLCNINEPVGQVFDSSVNHGTAVLGELVALDTPGNQYGVKGLVPDATAWFFSIDSPGAVTAGIAELNPGDVILLELQISTIPGCATCYGPVELSQGVWDVTKVATDCGIIVVAAAGNGNQDLDGPATPYVNYRSWGDSGSIIVGAGQDLTSHDRLGFSTYGSRVNVQGWGRGVFTLGYGTHFNFECPSIADSKQWYRAGFNGTSSASPFVVAAAASLQSLAEAEFGCRIGPRQMRRLLIETGICQGEASLDKHIGSFPNMFSSIARLRELGELPGADCNGNGVSDVCDVGIAPAGGPPAFADANHDLVPDVCEPNGDCNTNGTPDLEDIGTGTSRDCNGNNMPDECDLASGTSADCNANGFPDDCEVSPNCIDQVPSADDCNANGVPDECDIASGTSLDCEGNGIPDECVESCVVANAPATEPGGVAKNRYASFVPGNGGADTAIRVALTSLPSPFTSFNGTKMWVDAPVERCENAATLTPPCSNPTDSFWASRHVCDPVYLDWSVYGTIHIYDDEIVPGAT